MKTTLMVVSALALLTAMSMPTQAQVLGMDGNCRDDLLTVNCIYYTHECSPSGSGDPCLPYNERHFCTLIVLGECFCWGTVFSCVP